MDERGILEFMLPSLPCRDPISTMSLRGLGLSIYKRGRRPSLMGRVGRVDGDQKGPSNFFEFVSISNLYTLMVHIIRTTNYRDVFILLTFFRRGGPKNGNLKFSEI